MKRTNPEKGLDVDPKFVEISWDEALDIVAEKLRAVKEEDPRQFHSSGGMAGGGLARGRFQSFFGGAPMHMFGGVAACGSSEHAVSTWAHNGHVSGYDPDYVELLILQGTNAGFGTWLGGAAGGGVSRLRGRPGGARYQDSEHRPPVRGGGEQGRVDTDSSWH